MQEEQPQEPQNENQQLLADQPQPVVNDQVALRNERIAQLPLVLRERYQQHNRPLPPYMQGTPLAFDGNNLVDGDIIRPRIDSAGYLSAKLVASIVFGACGTVLYFNANNKIVGMVGGSSTNLALNFYFFAGTIDYLRDLIKNRKNMSWAEFLGKLVGALFAAVATVPFSASAYQTALLNNEHWGKLEGEAYAIFSAGTTAAGVLPTNVYSVATFIDSCKEGYSYMRQRRNHLYVAVHTNANAPQVAQLRKLFDMRLSLVRQRYILNSTPGQRLDFPYRGTLHDKASIVLRALQANNVVHTDEQIKRLLKIERRGRMAARVVGVFFDVLLALGNTGYAYSTLNFFQSFLSGGASWALTLLAMLPLVILSVKAGFALANSIVWLIQRTMEDGRLPAPAAAALGKTALALFSIFMSLGMVTSAFSGGASADLCKDYCPEQLDVMYWPINVSTGNFNLFYLLLALREVVLAYHKNYGSDAPNASKRAAHSIANFDEFAGEVDKLPDGHFMGMIASLMGQAVIDQEEVVQEENDPLAAIQTLFGEHRTKWAQGFFRDGRWCEERMARNADNADAPTEMAPLLNTNQRQFGLQ